MSSNGGQRSTGTIGMTNQNEILATTMLANVCHFRCIIKATGFVSTMNSEQCHDVQECCGKLHARWCNGKESPSIQLVIMLLWRNCMHHTLVSLKAILVSQVMIAHYLCVDHARDGTSSFCFAGIWRLAVLPEEDHFPHRLRLWFDYSLKQKQSDKVETFPVMNSAPHRESKQTPLNQ